jgi:hypothetical protein
MSMHERDPEKYARESFSMRRPTTWQTSAMTVAGIAIVIALLAYALT